MSQNPLTAYTETLTRHLWNYRRVVFREQDERFDPEYSVLPNPPVFTKGHAGLNVIAPEDPALAAAVQRLVPPQKQHKWFRSMKSSQALAVSVFGNLKVLDRTDCLADVSADDGAGPAFRLGHIDAGEIGLEHEVDTLREIRATSIDVLVSGPTAVYVECKLSEPEVGRCSRPRLKKGHREHCDGTYSRQGERTHRCALAERGMAYWDHIPKILTWEVDQDHAPCPLAEPYQLVRNVLAACVREGEVTGGCGHALLVYDDRNPAFHPRTDGTFERLREQLLDSSLLRRCSWQSILKVMADYDDLRWLLRALDQKYGLAPEREGSRRLTPASGGSALQRSSNESVGPVQDVLANEVDLTPEDFPDKERLRGFEGGSVYTAERDGRFFLITDERSMADFLDEEDLADMALAHVYEFDSEVARREYAQGRGWLKNAES